MGSWGVTLTTHLYLAQRIMMSGAVLCPLYMLSWRGLGKLYLLNTSVCLTTLLVIQNVNFRIKDLGNSELN